VTATAMGTPPSSPSSAAPSSSVDQVMRRERCPMPPSMLGG
jgi:hypothetical protein